MFIVQIPEHPEHKDHQQYQTYGGGPAASKAWKKIDCYGRFISSESECEIDFASKEYKYFTWKLEHVLIPKVQYEQTFRVHIDRQRKRKRCQLL